MQMASCVAFCQVLIRAQLFVPAMLFVRTPDTTAIFRWLTQQPRARLFGDVVGHSLLLMSDDLVQRSTPSRILYRLVGCLVLSEHRNL